MEFLAKTHLQNIIASLKNDPKILSLKSAEKWLDYNKINKAFEFYQFLKKYIKEGDFICDIGAGNGFILWFFRNLKNCDIYGTDIKYESTIFSVIKEKIGLTSYFGIEEVKKFTPMILGNKKFNAIICKLPVFHREKDPLTNERTFWGTKEWEFFINDISKHLLPNGYFILYPNDFEKFVKVYEQNFDLNSLKKIKTSKDRLFLYQKT